MTLYSGKEVDIFNLSIKDIDIEDIAHSLANICRYGGHCLFHYSVALHSYLCSLEPGTPKQQLKYLLHDGSEALMNDLVRPIKYRPELTAYREQEEKVQKLIFEKYQLEYPFTQDIHDVDNRILVKEIGQIIIMKHEIYNKSAEAGISLRDALKILRDEKLAKCTIPKISPEEAKELFLNRFYELYKK